MPSDKAGQDGWVVVGSGKKKEIEKRLKKREEEAKAAAAEAAKAMKQNTAFSALADDRETKKEKAARKEAEEKAKNEKNMSEKEAAKKHQKKVENLRAKEKRDTTKAASPKSKATFADAAVRAGDAPRAELREIPKKYPGRTKDQFYTAMTILNDIFNADVVISSSFKTLNTVDRWAHPTQGLGKDTSFQKALCRLIDGSDDDLMWNASLRDCLLRVFGPDGCRVDEGRHYLGTRFLVQTLLRHRPQAFTVAPGKVEDLFTDVDRKLSNPHAAANYAWVLAQLTDGAACEAVASWASVYGAPIIEHDGKDASAVVSQVGMELAEQLSQLKPSDEAKSAYKAQHNGEPVPANLLWSCFEQVAPKKKRYEKLCKTLLPQYSVLFTAGSPGRHFHRTAQLLRKCNDVSKPLILDTLVEAVVLDPNGVLTYWTNDLLPVVKETSMILDAMHAKEKYLSTRANGMEMERFFDRLGNKCQDIQSGKLAPTAKQAKRCNFDASDVSAIQSRLSKVASLASALPTDAPVSKKQAAKLNKHIRDKSETQGGFGFGSFIFMLIAVALAVYIALPFLPPPLQAQIKQAFNKHGKPVVDKVSAAVMPHIEKVLKAAK
eukprot:TRINITY_DN18099_c0_g1_i1.p2 TRINITY_DN18099_c0_g1~~TRINITY_DN18099_c0_g1_i1.p2  ORF type:complete len:605 (+),score=333.14 TRINITY_DN18099_c0_g1_i1:75-1889(+)